MADKEYIDSSYLGVPPTHEEITKKAFQLWKELGEPKGQDQEIWKKAESILKQSKQKKNPLTLNPSHEFHSSENQSPSAPSSLFKETSIQTQRNNQKMDCIEIIDFDALFEAIS